MAMNEWKSIQCILYKADTPRLRMQNMFSYLDFRCYFEANGQNHIQFWLIKVLKNSMTWYFLTSSRPLSSKLEIVYSRGDERSIKIFDSARKILPQSARFARKI